MARSFSNADANDLIERADFLSHSIAQQQSIAEEFDARFRRR